MTAKIKHESTLLAASLCDAVQHLQIATLKKKKQSINTTKTLRYRFKSGFLLPLRQIPSVKPNLH